jgi:hypothetical protein
MSVFADWPPPPWQTTEAELFCELQDAAALANIDPKTKALAGSAVGSLCLCVFVCLGI